MMLSVLLKHLDHHRVILASQSPRRFELLRDCGLCFEVIPSSFEENLPKEQFPTPDRYVLENAKQKALDVLNRVSHEKQAHSKLSTIVIGCDTVVVLDGIILEKPEDEEDAFNIGGMNNPHLFYEKTSLLFGHLEPEDIRAYIATGEPMDKAGAYGLQGQARCFVKEIHGCSNNVIGFPVQRFCQELKYLASRNEM
ncbi:unnamed protein product [Peronospora belbahrii]|uniref:Maf-like protein n=1 Tax=Peronospora belbahrii TaxID=622444 RepID=A0AAU9L6V9_9STRA|nr:unnamed protein product [Peronospora belbahrii]